MEPARARAFPSVLLRVPSTLFVALFGLALMAAIWMAVALHESAERAAEIKRVHSENDAFARAFEEHIRRVFQTADDALLFLKQEYERHGGVTEAMSYFVDRARRDPILNQIAVVDPGGNLVLSALPRSRPINVSRNETFQVHVHDSTRGLFVGKPIITQIAGTWSFFLTRRLNRPDGTFAGIVSVGLDPAYFSSYYDQLELGKDRGILVVGRDGIVRARRFQQHMDIGQDLRASPMFARLPTQPVGHYEVQGIIDGLRRFSSYRALPDFPVIVVVSDLTRSALAPWEHRWRETRIWAIAFTLLLAGFFLIVIVAGRRGRRRRAQLAAELAERRRAEEALRETGERFRDLFENANDAIFLLDERHRYIDANRRAVELFGFTREEFLGHEVYEFIPPEQAERSATTFRELVERGQYRNFEGRMRTKDGRWLDIEVSSSAIVRDGRFAGSRDIVRDVTKRKNNEKRIALSESRLRESQQVARIGNWSWDVGNGSVEWSEETFRRFDKDPATFTPTLAYFLERIHPEDRGTVERAIRDSLESGAPHHIEPRVRNESGREWVLEAFGKVECDAAGRPLRFAGTVQDITAHKAAEERLARSEEFIRSILDTVDEGFIVVDRELRILTVNRAYCDQVGRPAGEIVGRLCHEISHRSSRPCYEAGETCAVRRAFETAEMQTALHRHRDGGGQQLFIETKAFPIRDAAGNVISVIETLNNISEKHLLEEERLKAQKLESIGTLAGGIAHDFNNLLQGIFGYISMARMCLEDGSEAAAMIGQAEQALHRTVNLTNQLLTFSRGGKPVKRPVALAALIENAAKFALSGSRTTCRLDFEPGVSPVDADAGQLGQVIQNIVLNADQAMPAGGCVEIAARNVLPGNAALSPGLAARRYVQISIRDTGIGIPQDRLGQIFDPYFTTKEKGSGLGLATSYSIVRNHGGRIDVRSEVGTGTEFTILLPAAERPAEEPQAVPATGAGRAARILVMDDEQIVRNVAHQLLSALGHTVVCVEQGEAALEAYRAARSEGRPFGVVVLDLTIRGGMGGLETARRLHEIDAGATLVASSGYSDDATLANHQAQGFSAFLKKPYNLAELRETVDALLA